MMSDVLHQPQGNAHGPPQPPLPSADSRAGISPVGGGVAGGRGNTPNSVERLKHRMNLYRERNHENFDKYTASMGAQTKQHKEDTQKLQKKFIDNAKAKKTNKKSDSKNSMKPQPQNGLKRPHPGANNSELPNSDSKRLNLDQGPMGVGGAVGPPLGVVGGPNNPAGGLMVNHPNVQVKTEVKQEPLPVPQSASAAASQQQNQPNSNNDILSNSNSNSMLETKVKSEVKPDLTNAESNNEASLDDFDVNLDLENSDFQDLMKDISDLNPEMLDLLNNKNMFDDLDTPVPNNAPTAADGSLTAPMPISSSALSGQQSGSSSAGNSMPNCSTPGGNGPPNLGPGGHPGGDLSNNTQQQGAMTSNGSNNIAADPSASEKLKYMAQQRQQQMPMHPDQQQQQQQQQQQPPPQQQQPPQQFPPQQQHYSQAHQIPHSSYNNMMPQQRPNMMYAQQQQQQMYPGGPPHHQMMGMMPHHPVRHGIRPGIRPGMPPMGPMGPHHGPGGPMGPMMNSMGPMGNHNMMPNGVGPPMNHGPGPGPQGNVSLPTTPLPKSSGGSIVGNGSNSPLHNSIATSNNNSSGNSTPSSSATPPHSARGTPPLSTATPTNSSGSNTITTSSSVTNGPRMHAGTNNMRMPMGGPPGGPGGPPGPPPGAAPMGGPGPQGQMYGNNMHMSADVRMRAAASSRYRLGNPSASSMRPNMNPHPMGVPPGQSSPMGGNPMGPMGPGGQMPMMPNQGMRPQQVRKVKKLFHYFTRLLIQKPPVLQINVS